MGKRKLMSERGACLLELITPHCNTKRGVLSFFGSSIVDDWRTRLAQHQYPASFTSSFFGRQSSSAARLAQPHSTTTAAAAARRQQHRQRQKQQVACGNLCKFNTADRQTDSVELVGELSVRLPHSAGLPLLLLSPSLLTSPLSELPADINVAAAALSPLIHLSVCVYSGALSSQTHKLHRWPSSSSASERTNWKGTAMNSITIPLSYALKEKEKVLSLCRNVRLPTCLTVCLHVASDLPLEQSTASASSASTTTVADTLSSSSSSALAAGMLMKAKQCTVDR